MCCANPSTGSHDQLVTRGRQVTWLEGLDPETETIKKVYSVETPILQAFWCRFPEEGGGVRGCGCVCIREQGCLGIYMDSGAVYFVPFLFPVSLSFLPCMSSLVWCDTSTP